MARVDKKPAYLGGDAARVLCWAVLNSDREGYNLLSEKLGTAPSWDLARAEHSARHLARLTDDDIDEWRNYDLNASAADSDTVLAVGSGHYTDLKLAEQRRDIPLATILAIVLLHFTSCPTFDDVTATLMGVRDWLTHHRYHRRHRCPTFDDVTATLMGVRDDVMTGNHYKVQKDYCRELRPDVQRC